MHYLVTGATGNIGARVVECLLARGERPRVFARNLDKARTRFGDRVELVAGDLGDERSLEAALVGIDTLFLASSGPDLARHDGLAAKLSLHAGVKRIVKLSVLGSRASGLTTAVAGGTFAAKMQFVRALFRTCSCSPSASCRTRSSGLDQSERMAWFAPRRVKAALR